MLLYFFCSVLFSCLFRFLFCFILPSVLLSKLLWLNSENHEVSYFRHKLTHLSVPRRHPYHLSLLFKMTNSVTFRPIQMMEKITPSLISEYCSSQELKRIITPRAKGLALGSFMNLFLTQVKLSSQNMKN